MGWVGSRTSDIHGHCRNPKPQTPNSKSKRRVSQRLGAYMGSGLDLGNWDLGFGIWDLGYVVLLIRSISSRTSRSATSETTSATTSRAAPGARRSSTRRVI